MRKSRIVGPVLFICFMLPIIFLGGCGQDKSSDVRTVDDGQPKSGGVLRLSLLDDPASLDPANFNDELAVKVGKEIFDGLVDFDYRTNRIVPAHAERWDVKDNRVFTFYLRKGTRFSNGKEVTAEDFKYSFERLLDPATAAKDAFILENVKGAEDRLAGKTKDTEGIKVIDKYTLQITLDRPNAGFIYRLTHPGAAVVDKDIIEKNSKAFAATGAGPELLVGSGPFKLAQWKPNNIIKLVRNDDYYGTKAYLDEVDFRVIPDETTTLNEFRAGNIDIIERIPPGQNNLVKKEFPGQTFTGAIWGIEFYGFNLHEAPFKDNVKLRQALNYAIDRQGIIDAVLEGNGLLATSLLPPGMTKYQEQIDGYTYDPAKAKALLAEAGYPGGRGLGEVELTYNTRETNQKIAEAVQAQWKAIGFRTKLKPLPLPEFRQEIENGSFSIFRLGWTADYPEPDSILFPLFSSQAENIFGYANSKVDRLLNQALVTGEDSRRAQLYREAEQQIIDDAPAVVMFYPATEYLKGKNIQGIVTDFEGMLSLDKIWISR